jgi:hypothetical protein
MCFITYRTQLLCVATQHGNTTKQKGVACISTIVVQFVYRQRTASAASVASETSGQKLVMTE